MKLAALLALLILLTSPAYVLLGEASTPFTEPLSDWIKIFALGAFAALRTRFWDGAYLARSASA